VKFLVDNSISPIVASGLMDAGHDAVHVREYGIQSDPDESVIDRALVEARIVITYDLDFPRILALRRLSKPSLIVFRGVRNPARQVVAILNNLKRLQTALGDGSIAVIERDKIRIRDLPLGSRGRKDA
jgi:predicted nuclease of predicted toxin-antitoxin system